MNRDDRIRDDRNRDGRKKDDRKRDEKSRNDRSRDDRRRARRQSIIYPTSWTEWEWDENKQRYRKEREIAKDTFEVKERRHLEEDYEGTPRPADRELRLPANDTGSGSHQRSTSPYSMSEAFETDPVATLSTQFAEATLAPPLPPPLNNVPRAALHVITCDPTTTAETLDPDYKVHDAWHFKFGKVFKVLWSEPGGTDKEDEGAASITVKRGRFGEPVLQKVRRFVVIDIRKGHCICLPIMTYQGKGTGKRGVHAEDHAIIYTTRPQLVGKEDPLDKKPIKVIPTSSRHKLEPASRLNYAKIYTIEYNVKVLFVGQIAKESEWEFVGAYNIVHPPIRTRGGSRPPPPLVQQDRHFLGTSQPSNPPNPPPGNLQPPPRIAAPAPSLYRADPSSLGHSQTYQTTAGPAPSSYYAPSTTPSTRSQRSGSMYGLPGTATSNFIWEQSARFPPNEGSSEVARSDFQQPPRSVHNEQFLNVNTRRLGPVQTTDYQYHEPDSMYEYQRAPEKYPQPGLYVPPGPYAPPRLYAQQPLQTPQGGAGPRYQPDNHPDARYYNQDSSRPPHEGDDQDNNDIYDA